LIIFNHIISLVRAELKLMQCGELSNIGLPICEIWCKIYKRFRSLVYFILPITDVRNFSDRK